MVGNVRVQIREHWWRTLWRRLLRTNKDGFSFTGGMHLHSLEAKASEPSLMKRNPRNHRDFNGNAREGKKRWGLCFYCLCGAMERHYQEQLRAPNAVVCQRLWCKLKVSSPDEDTTYTLTHSYSFIISYGGDMVLKTRRKQNVFLSLISCYHLDK
jgi:hypothetical protein